MTAKLDAQTFYAILLSNEPLRVSDALILLEGDGFNRVPKTAELYKNGLAPTVVVSGGVDDPLKGGIHSRFLKERLGLLGVPSERIIIEDISQNTRDQAVEIMKMVRERAWRRITLVASHYHVFRAFLTFLKAMQEAKLSVEIFCAPVRDLPWFSGEQGPKRADLLASEFEKIGKYTDHMATFTDAVEYIERQEHATT